MDGFVVHEVAADVVVRVGRAMPELPSVRGSEVERLWQAASAAGGGRRGRAAVQRPGVQRRSPSRRT